MKKMVILALPLLLVAGLLCSCGSSGSDDPFDSLGGGATCDDYCKKLVDCAITTVSLAKCAENCRKFNVSESMISCVAGSTVCETARACLASQF